MSAYNPIYNPASYLTDIYGRPVPENPYALFYPGPSTDQYVPCHWTPDPNQAFYAPSISQGIPLGWHRPPTLSANSNNPYMYPRGYSTAPPNPTYLLPAHYYAYPVPAAAPTPLGPTDNHSPPHMPFPTQAPPSPRQQRVEAYAQQCNEVLCFLCLSPMEFARCTHTLLTNLGYSDTSATLEVWADRLLDFHKRYLQGNLPETIQDTLGIDDNLRNKLHALVKEIHTSLNPCPFEDPLDPARSFHVQCKEPIGTQNKAPPFISHQQEELNAAFSILRNLNPPAVSEPHSQRPPPHVDDNNWTLSYIDEPGNSADKHAPCNGPLQDRPPHFNLRAPHVNAPLPHPNAPVPPQQPMGPGVPRLPFSTNHPRPPPTPMPNPPTNANYFGLPTPRGPP
ncbi:hypothetical protein E4T56_gene16148 [Termitomyces sp. T112]|nr:hypothetical protein E4T56_gene16148 [Termitomyces sp. T112]